MYPQTREFFEFDYVINLLIELVLFSNNMVPRCTFLVHLLMPNTAIDHRCTGSKRLRQVKKQLPSRDAEYTYIPESDGRYVFGQYV